MANNMLVSLVIVVMELHCFSSQSLSRLKTVTMSSQHENWVGSRAVDGNYNRESATCNCCAATNITRDLVDQWMEIDLGETAEFTRIVVYGQTSGEWERRNLIGLEIHLDDSERSIASIIDTDQGFVNFYHFDLGQKYSARHLRLILKGTDKVLELCEVDVFNDFIISNGKNVTAISTYADWTPSYAVDGGMRPDPDVCLCCAATNYHTDPWLNVDLGNEFLITYIQMFGLKDNRYSGQSFEGMNVTIDDVIIKTVPTSGTFISYFEIVPTPETIGRNVRLTLTGERRLLVMCELVIYGVCKLSTYGTNNCVSCGNCRGDVTCNPGNGHCTECADGYVETDKTCKTRCSEGLYGYNCSELCGRCRQDEPCEIATGHCKECKDGYTYSDPLCKTGCNIGLYGRNCIEACGNCRNGEICDAVYGYCTECENGYTERDKTCKTRCLPGSYGRNCDMACGSCKDGLPCNHVDGSCEDCINGTYVFDDKLCNKACKPHTYGYNCTGNCGNCRNGVACDSMNGHCVECEDGYTNTDKQCYTRCNDGTFGSNCQHTCGMCACGQVCNRTTGECPNGCLEGYHGDTCLLLISENKGTTTCISLPVYIGSMVAIACVTFAITFTIMFWRLRQTKTSNSKGEEAHTVREPHVAPPNETASNYESLQFDNIRSENNYSEFEC